jgi:hypothetical protein
MPEAEHDALEKMHRHFDRLIGFPKDEWERIVP